MPFTTKQIPDLTGKTAIVTGGNTGIGFTTIQALLEKNAKVFLAARDPARAEAAISKLKNEFPNAKIEFLQLDLADIKQTKEAAEKFVKSGESLNILINNAGIMTPPFALTKDGIETQFGVNHLGHFVFTTTLLPAIERSTPARIVNVSSLVHTSHPDGGIQFDKINDEKAMSTVQRYGQSKLANILFSKSIAEKYEGKQIWVNSVHPGVVDTELLRGPYALAEQAGWKAKPLVFLGKLFMPLMQINPQQGALTTLYAATSTEIVEKDYRGQYFVPYGKLEKPAPLAESKELRDKLWAFSEKTVAEKLGSKL
ncbi:hypothetical protein BJ742DRAFT_831580 [Cladochytrium replicatum]|nr:hypothetical protein BJ742DRAFT_831580 [Cladochytrium replicatum]